MNKQGKKKLRPRVETVENRCLLSTAVVDIQNQSNYTVTFDFRWTPSSAWSAYTESPGQSELISTAYSSSLTPQVLYDTTTSARSETIVNLAQGYGDWTGTGTPPASSATDYGFENTTTGVELYYLAPPSSTDAVVDITNNSSYDITFDFRWSSSSAWTAYTEAPGQSETIYTTYSSTLTPQVLYDTTTASSSQTTVSLSQGYGEWTGTGTPPASAGTPYAFSNTATGVTLSHAGTPTPTPTPPPSPTPTPTPPPSPTPTPTPPPSPTPTPTPTPTPPPNTGAVTSSNWSGYAAATNLSSPEAGSVSAVSGSWIVPTVTGSGRGTTYSAVWVGIDGYSDSTVEQIGTEENVVNGVPEYAAWWEMYSTGKGQPEQVITGMTIEPGDSITASVQYISSGTYAGDFLLSIVDNSRANDSFSAYESSSQLQSPVAERSSAEWIVEAPTVGSNVASLANFGSATFTNASATINGVTGPINDSAWQSQAINIGSGSVTQDTTSVLTASGTSFVVTYDSTSGSADVSGGRDAATLHSSATDSGTSQSGKTTSSTVVIAPAWSGTSTIFGFRTPVRQVKRSSLGFSSGSLFD